MSEEVTPPKESAGSDESQGSQGAPDGYIPKDKFDSELSEAIKRRDSALKRAREAESELAKIKEDSFSKQKQKAVSEGNADEQRKLFEAELNKERQEKAKLQDALKSLTLETKVKSKLSQFTDYLDVSWKALKDDFTVEQDEDGLFKPVIKSNPFANVDEYLKGFFEEAPGLAKNPKRAGTGIPRNANGFQLGTGESVTFEQMDGMSREDRVALQRKDPKLYKAYTKYKADKAMGR